MSQIVASRPILQIFAAFFGFLGIDRFYAGQTGLGVLKLLTCGACGIWATVDFLIQVLEGVGKSKITRYGSSISIDESSIQPGFYVGLVFLALFMAVFVMTHSGGANGRTGASRDDVSDEKNDAQLAETTVGSRTTNETSAKSYSL